MRIEITWDGIRHIFHRFHGCWTFYYAWTDLGSLFSHLYHHFSCSKIEIGFERSRIFVIGEAIVEKLLQSC